MTAVKDEDVRTLLIPGQCDLRDYGALTATGPDGLSSGDAESEAGVQDGAMQSEALTRTWSKWGLVIAYMRWADFGRPEGYILTVNTRAVSSS
jgi:hypothetical protein